MSLVSADLAAVKGPGSVPVKDVASGATTRGMFNRGAELKKLSSIAEIEGEDAVLFIHKSALPDVDVDSRIQMGEPDLAAANTVQETDPTWRVGRRSPIDDGEIHALVLEGGRS